MKTIFTPVTTEEQIDWIAEVAPGILHEVYTPYIPAHHTDHFISQHQSKEAISRQISLEGHRYWVLEFKGKKTGYLGLEPKGKSLVLSKLYLLKEFRGKGIGGDAIRYTDQFALANGFDKIELIANQNNKKAIETYTHFGYEIADGYTTKHETGVSICDYRMEKKLI